MSQAQMAMSSGDDESLWRDREYLSDVQGDENTVVAPTVDEFFAGLKGICPKCDCEIVPSSRGDFLRCTSCNWAWEPR